MSKQEKLGLAHGPAASSIRWIGDRPNVPVEVAATGPKVVGIAARQADRVMLVVGADPKRLAWAIETARSAAAEAGRLIRPPPFAAVVPDNDPSTMERA